MGDLLLPVGNRRMSSWAQHQRRNPRSTEPGTDWYCPIGTLVLAPADGWIYGYGRDIKPATGLWNGIEFANGMSFRAMHYSDLIRTSGSVERGEPIAYSGATGYGDWDWSDNPATGGAHVHGTLWPTYTRRFGYQSNGKPWTVDFMAHVGGSTAGVGSNTFQEDDMFTDEDRADLKSVALALGAAGLAALPADQRWPDSVMGRVREIRALADETLARVKRVEDETRGLPLALGSIGAEVRGVPIVLAAIRAAIDGLEGSDGGRPFEGLSDEDVLRFAKAAADEQARRLSS